MLPKQLSDRQDLVETVDSEIIDYLSKHGVIDDSLIGQLQKLQSCTERNVALLSAIESKGDTAVALFVNALRQSGQLHLASSLDKAPRIKPTVQGGKIFFCRIYGGIEFLLHLTWSIYLNLLIL